MRHCAFIFPPDPTISCQLFIVHMSCLVISVAAEILEWIGIHFNVKGWSCHLCWWLSKECSQQGHGTKGKKKKPYWVLHKILVSLPKPGLFWALTVSKTPGMLVAADSVSAHLYLLDIPHLCASQPDGLQLTTSADLCLWAFSGCQSSLGLSVNQADGAGELTMQVDICPSLSVPWMKYF